jgi:hypothetical protein
VASATAVVPIRNLLTRAEVAELLAAAERVKKDCGRTGRDAGRERLKEARTFVRSSLSASESLFRSSV